MVHDADEDRVRRKAHELWEAEGRPHGRDQDHWEQAREIIAIQDSQASTLLPRETGAEEPVEDRQAAGNYGDMPNLTDQGDSTLTDTSREPSFTGAGAQAKPAKPRKSKESGPPDAIKPAKSATTVHKTAQTASIVAGSAKSNRKATAPGKVN